MGIFILISTYSIYEQFAHGVLHFRFVGYGHLSKKIQNFNIKMEFI